MSAHRRVVVALGWVAVATSGWVSGTQPPAPANPTLSNNDCTVSRSE